MIKAVLQYTDCLQDGTKVFRTLAKHNVTILKTKSGPSIYPKITILTRGYNELNVLVEELNYNCRYEVRVVKTKIIKKGI